MQASQQPSSSQGAQITITKPNTLMNAYDQQMFPGSPAVNPAYGSPYPAPPPLSGAPQPTSYPPPPSKSNSIYSASASTGAPIISYAVPSSASSSATQPTLAQPVKADYSTGSSTGAPVTSYAAPSYAMPPPSYSDHDRTFLSTPPQQAGAGSVLALFDYASETPGDLSFKAGETIVVRERSTDGWWRGSVAGRMQEEGVFPSNFVRDA
ncbi:SH3 domain-containing protein [Chytriomyces sp. MP71]|nr:SH3 domain-containing protein [Chytriomyces sp. MP71]